MFATLLGALPSPTADADGASEDPVVAAIRAQEAAGLEPITDGRLRDPGFDRLVELLLRPDGVDDAVTAVLEGWRTLAAATERATKQALPGPFSVGLRAGGTEQRASRRGRSPRRRRSRRSSRRSQQAGCPLVEIEEADVAPARGRRRAASSSARPIAGSTEAGHGARFIAPCRSSVGRVPQAAIDDVLEAPYASLAVDLIAGPDNWYVVRRAPRRARRDRRRPLGRRGRRGEGGHALGARTTRRRAAVGAATGSGSARRAPGRISPGRPRSGS